MADRKVDFFFVGYPKSGSTTFYDLLKAHPEIFSPDVKEVNYFNSDYRRELEKQLGANYFQLIESDESYSKFFQGPEGTLKGDFNPTYIFSEEAARNIHNYNPAAKILVSVREPVSFLRSFHFQSLYNMVEDQADFLQALALEESRRAGRNIPRYCHNPFDLYYSSLVKYKTHIQRYVDTFGPANTRIVLFDDVMAREGQVYMEMLEFLGVKDTDFVPPQPDRNPSHALRFAWLRQFLFRPAVKKWLYTSIPAPLLPLGAKISHRIFKKAQEKPFVSREDIERLKQRFKPEVVELDAFLRQTGLLERDLLALWGY